MWKKVAVAVLVFNLSLLQGANATYSAESWCIDKYQMLTSGLVESCNHMPTDSHSQFEDYSDCLSLLTRRWMVGVGDVCRGPVAFDACIEACYPKGQLNCYSICRAVR